MLFICKCIFLLLLHNPYLHGNYCVKGLNEARSKFSITHVHQSEEMKSSCDVQGQEEKNRGVVCLFVLGSEHTSVTITLTAIHSAAKV